MNSDSAKSRRVSWAVLWVVLANSFVISVGLAQDIRDTPDWDEDEPIAQAYVSAEEYARQIWGDVEFYNVTTYYDLDDSPEVYAFVFYRGTDRALDIDELKSNLQASYAERKRIAESIRELKANSNSRSDADAIAELESLQWQEYRAKLRHKRTASFSTVLVSAHRSDSIVHAHAGLPSHLILLPYLQARITERSRAAEQVPLRVYYKDRFTQLYSLGSPGDLEEPVSGASRSSETEFIDFTSGDTLTSSDFDQVMASTKDDLSVRAMGTGGAFTTIITHGWQLDGELPDWVDEMAQAIRLNDGPARVFEFNKSLAQFTEHADSDSGADDAILVFDWATVSNDGGEGHSEAAGDVLFQALLYGEKIDQFSLDNLHFIGHSRGTVVNSEAVERLVYSGYPVAQTTMLDPHDTGSLWGHYADDKDVNSDTLGFGVVSWKGIAWADNYWSTGDGALGALDPDGFAVAGTYDEGTEFGEFLNHSEVHDWYHGTIETNNLTYPLPDDWYGQDGRPERDVGGYNHARSIRNGAAPPSDGGYGDKTPVEFRFGSATEANASVGIVNGDFSRAGGAAVETPGWFHFGGIGGYRDTSSESLKLVTFYNEGRHNWFWIPQHATQLKYDFWIHDRDTVGSPKDEFQVLIGGQIKDSVVLDYESTVLDVRSINLDVADKDDQRVTFQIVPGSGDTADSTVFIDNVRLAVADYAPPEPVPLPPANVTATSGTNGGSVLVEWDDVAGEDGYTVYRLSFAHGMEMIGTTPANVLQFTDNDVECGGTWYKYFVKANKTIWNAIHQQNVSHQSAWFSPEAYVETGGCGTSVIWVDFNHTGAEDGSMANPFNTLAEGLAAVDFGGMINIVSNGSSFETFSGAAQISQDVTIQAAGSGLAEVGVGVGVSVVMSVKGDESLRVNCQTITTCSDPTNPDVPLAFNSTIVELVNDSGFPIKIDDIVWKYSDDEVGFVYGTPVISGLEEVLSGESRELYVEFSQRDEGLIGKSLVDYVDITASKSDDPSITGEISVEFKHTDIPRVDN